MRFIQFVILGVLTCTVYDVVATTTYHNALEAQERGDFATAAQAWKQLASSGDPIAQYNLAMLYQSGQGVKADVSTAQHWFTLAARQGLTEAYKQLNNKSVQPTSNSVVAAAAAPTHIIQNISVAPVLNEPRRWVQALNQDNYTVQLVSSTNEDVVIDYYRNSKLEGKAGYFRSKRQGQMWYTLVFGEFATVAEASAAVEKLPPELKKWSPWIRNVSDIQRQVK